MIIDRQADPDHAQRYDILDADTYQPILDPAIFYANDGAGVLRYYVRDASGTFGLPNPEGDIPWSEVRRRIRLVRNANL